MLHCGICDRQTIESRGARNPHVTAQTIEAPGRGYSASTAGVGRCLAPCGGEARPSVRIPQDPGDWTRALLCEQALLCSNQWRTATCGCVCDSYLTGSFDRLSFRRVGAKPNTQTKPRTSLRRHPSFPKTSQEATGVRILKFEFATLYFIGVIIVENT